MPSEPTQPSDPTQPLVGLIWAQAANGVVGADGRLPWDLPEDLAHFATTTRGRPVLMGRRTWESLPERVRPLPGRANVVLTRTPGYLAPGAQLVGSVADALTAAGPGRCWALGGASVWADLLPHADLAVVTEIAERFVGDTPAPVLDATWVGDDGPWRESRTGLHFRVRTLRRTPG